MSETADTQLRGVLNDYTTQLKRGKLERLSEYEDAFRFFRDAESCEDVGGKSGQLDLEKLPEVMRSLGLQPPSYRDWHQYFKEHEFRYIQQSSMDITLKQGKVCFEDFLFIIEKKHQDRYTRPQIVAAFEVLDQMNGDEHSGVVAVADLYHMMLSLGSGTSEQECKEMAMAADIEGTGSIKYAGLIDVIMGVCD